jgi:hypothetical protein
MRKPYSKPTVQKHDARGEKGKRLLAQVDGPERRRSTRVLIQIPIQAHFLNGEGAEARSDIFTLAVNAHGCLLAMDIKPTEGQRMRLLNVKSGIAQTGKVIRVERSREGFFAVAFEFDSPSPHLWSILTPPEDWLVHKPK